LTDRVTFLLFISIKIKLDTLKFTTLAHLARRLFSYRYHKIYNTYRPSTWTICAW